jgi:hypothetical protein
VPDLAAVAGALVSDDSQLIFTSNRGEDTIGVFAPGPNPKVTKIAVGVRPNGLAYDAKRRLVLAANVGEPAVPHSYTLSMVDLDAGSMRASIEVRAAHAGPCSMPTPRFYEYRQSLADRCGRCAQAQPGGPHHARPADGRAWPRFRSGDVPAVLRLRRGRTGHARCRQRRKS